MNSKVSIIITAYNYAEYLPEAIESALSQTYPSEVIVVNDGSTDFTDDICRSYGNRIVYIYQDNQGLRISRNNGIAASSGEYVLCLDADDVIDSNYVFECVQKMEEGYDIVCSNWIEFQDNPNSSIPDYLHYIDTNHLTYQDFVVANRIICASMFRKNLFYKVGKYDLEMPNGGYEDWSLWRRIIKNGGRVGVVQKVLFFYRKHGVSMVDDAIRKHNVLVDYMNKSEGMV